MHLRLEVVEHRHAVLARDERIDEMRADVAGAAGDEDVTNAHRMFALNSQRPTANAQPCPTPNFQ